MPRKIHPNMIRENVPQPEDLIAAALKRVQKLNLTNVNAMAGVIVAHLYESDARITRKKGAAKR